MLLVHRMMAIHSRSIRSWIILFQFVLLGHFKSDKDSFSSFRYQTSNHFLSHILCWVVEQLLKLQTRELLDDLILSSNHHWILRLKLLVFVFLLEHVLYQPSSAVSHLAQPIIQPLPCVVWVVIHLVALLLDVGHMPHIMTYELLHPLALIHL